ncbi:hypothetical protein LUZ63_006914 [Rhynchospora breviuscula]|uniref:Aminotransferase-like plant mobile domain-containing protein n=1 Tax=Rhynchospora breviuscula TaxID=2022672 RepID=A0A9Q0CQP5_9POAL|nr:hypothetical protein LUZ63_006914 [Rhynchospora breviuscula]
MLEIFGCELFPDGTGDSDLHSSNSVQYNWGGATLAMLYRGLDTAFINNNINIGAPWLLLQLWSYARLLLSRPSITKDFDGWGLPSIDLCPPYGRKWTTRHKSKKFTTRSGIEYARDVCMKMNPEYVVWRPYDHIRDCMPRCAQVEQKMFLLRIPCIHYWVVMWHHVDRVMHQFMLYQTVPPPSPEVKHTLREALRGYAWVVKKEFHRAGLQLLRGCGTSLDIVGEPDQLSRLLESKGLHSDIDSIPDTDDEDDAPEPGSVEEQLFMRDNFSLHDWDTFFDVPRPSQPLVRSRRSHSGVFGPHSGSTRSHSQPRTTEPQVPPHSQSRTTQSQASPHSLPRTTQPQPPPHSQPQTTQPRPPSHSTQYFTYGSPYPPPPPYTQTQYGGGYGQPFVSTPTPISQADAY